MADYLSVLTVANILMTLFCVVASSLQLSPPSGLVFASIWVGVVVVTEIAFYATFG